MRRDARDVLTRRQREILEHLREHEDTEEGELIHEGREAYLGSGCDDPVSPRTVLALQRLCAITPLYDGDARPQYYVITGWGKALLDGDVSHLRALARAAAKRRRKEGPLTNKIAVETMTLDSMGGHVSQGLGVESSGGLPRWT